MSKSLCIHGHFYQPPRLDPWLGAILPEASAAPELNWNARIIKESYQPLGWAKRLADDKITNIINAYEWMSFNFGPTLLSYLESDFPLVYRRILEADAASLKRLGHGNALAQIYHHIIMPLATEQDKIVETAWALADFKARFGRDAEGIWLSETAVDTPTLEVLVEAGLRFTILAPSQAKAVGPIGSEAMRQVDEGGLDARQPYLVELPSGRSITVFFYNGGLSQAVAFEKLLADGENFYQRINREAGEGLLSLATDGETYGHHFPFGEMALAYVLEQAAQGRDDFTLTNYAAYLEGHPPQSKVLLHEPSAWSCMHGVERWRADCGCSTGERHGWNQKWRGPLREAMNDFKADIDRHFYAQGASLFKEPRQALCRYGQVLSGAQKRGAFKTACLKRGLGGAEVEKAFALLAMQQWSLSAFASCAWFFDDLARIEPVNAMTFALRAAELAVQTGCSDPMEKFIARLSQARSNVPEDGNGRDIFRRNVLPRKESPASLILLAAGRAWAGGHIDAPAHSGGAAGSTVSISWPEVNVCLDLSGKPSQTAGKAVLTWRHSEAREEYAWTLHWSSAPGRQPVPSALELKKTRDAKEQRSISMNELAWNKRQAISIEFIDRTVKQLWQANLEEASMAAAMFQPWQESQSTQPRDWLWLSIWPALAFNWITGEMEEKDRDLIDFIKDHKPNPLPGHLGKALLTYMLERLEAGPGAKGNSSAPAAKADNLAEIIPAMLRRMAEADIQIDPYPLQTALWDRRPWDERTSALAGQLGFKI